MPLRSIILGFARATDMPASALDCLDADERQRHAAMRSAARREEFLAGRVLAKLLLERATGRPATGLTITVTETGKPECEDGPGFSIAHSKGLVACAVAGDSEVGVDIEVPSPARHTRRISRAYFTEEESEWLADAPADSFYRLWALKEAWLKADGSGLSGGLGRLSCTIDGRRIRASVADGETPLLWLYEWQGAPVGLSMQAADSAPEVLEWSTERSALVAVDLPPLARTATLQT